MEMFYASKYHAQSKFPTTAKHVEKDLQNSRIKKPIPAKEIAIKVQAPMSEKLIQV